MSDEREFPAASDPGVVTGTPRSSPNVFEEMFDAARVELFDGTLPPDKKYEELRNEICAGMMLPPRLVREEVMRSGWNPVALVGGRVLNSTIEEWCDEPVIVEESKDGPANRVEQD